MVSEGISARSEFSYAMVVSNSVRVMMRKSRASKWNVEGVWAIPTKSSMIDRPSDGLVVACVQTLGALNSTTTKNQNLRDLFGSTSRGLWNCDCAMTRKR